MVARPGNVTGYDLLAAVIGHNTKKVSALTSSPHNCAELAEPRRTWAAADLIIKWLSRGCIISKLPSRTVLHLRLTMTSTSEPETVTSITAETYNPGKAASTIFAQEEGLLYSLWRVLVYLLEVQGLKSSTRIDDDNEQADLDKAAARGRFHFRPSDLFLKVLLPINSLLFCVPLLVLTFGADLRCCSGCS